LIWAISEHFDLEGLDPLLADDPEDPLNIIISNMHKILFKIDSSTTTSSRIQDVQSVLICAQRLGSRNARAGQLLTKELEEFRASTSADSVTKHQSRYVLQIIKYLTNHPDNRWVYSETRVTNSFTKGHHLFRYILS
jgi:Fe-S cluster biosynthesis and repair protein YggX